MISKNIVLKDFNKNIDVKPAELIGPYKFILLHTLSFGLYGLWWMYKSWKFFTLKEKLELKPVIRGILGVVFMFPYI